MWDTGSKRVPYLIMDSIAKGRGKEVRRMDEKRSCNTVEIERQPISAIDVSELLRISQRMEQFINDNGWSWCTMDKVYRVLKSAHQ